MISIYLNFCKQFKSGLLATFSNYYFKYTAPFIYKIKKIRLKNRIRQRNVADTPSSTVSTP